MSIDLPFALRRFSLRLTRLWKRSLPQGLFGRSMLILITPLVLTMMIGLYVFLDRHWTTTTTRLADSIGGEISLMTETWERESTPIEQKRLINLARQNLDMIIRFDNHSALPSTSPLDTPGLKILLKRSLQDKLDRPFTIASSTTYADHIVISVPVRDGILNFYVQQKRLFSTTTYVFLLITLGSGLFLSVIAVIFMRNQIRPIHRLALSAEQFGKGIDVPHFRPSGAREIRQASQAFLEMRDRIKRQIKQRTDMLAGVSHDLRTPLTRLKLELAMLPKEIDTEAMQGDIKVMEKMIKAYLDFARGESIENPLRCDLNDILQQALADAERQGLVIDATLPDAPIPIMIRPQAIQRVFTNVLENARLYAHKAWITVNKLSRHAEIIVDDDGPGISPNRREDVFKPFHRLDESRNQDIEGTGLGLTIARDLVQSHGGTISLSDSPYGGLRIILHLPL
jgi:two-component system osmolarity sensor histidine kinase EnvZ